MDKLFAKHLTGRDSASAAKVPLDTFWESYLDTARNEDEARPKDWDGTTGSILTFTGLFAATVAAFIIESYKLLSPDPSTQSVVLLGKLLAATTNTSSPSTAVGSFDDEASHASTGAILPNALWFCSLAVALACALLSTLVQQWSRAYVRDIQWRHIVNESLASRAINHACIQMGIERYGMDQVVYVIVALVHTSVILFAAGLILFLYPINSVVCWCAASTLSLFGILYILASILPLIDHNCPYRTPLTYLL
ncbi:hypothetical protein PENSPDRAFT_587205, partial [Peniophora sp. CONT]